MIRRPPHGSAEASAIAAAAICFGVMIVAALAWLIDERLLPGASVWAKPMKFGLSFGVDLVTLVWLATLLDDGTRDSRLARTALVTAAAAAALEVLYVALQAARGRASHFNTETPLEAFLYYQVMGGAALLIVAATFAIGFMNWRHGHASVGPGQRLGAALGAMVGSLAPLATAGVLAAGVVDGPGHWVGGERTDAHGLAVLGWATRGGDLRVPHFFATHLTQALPLAGLIADHIAAKRARPVVVAATVLGLALTGGTFWQAASGRPFIGG